jgi:hypothetical protein
VQGAFGSLLVLDALLPFCDYLGGSLADVSVLVTSQPSDDETSLSSL